MTTISRARQHYNKQRAERQPKYPALWILLAFCAGVLAAVNSPANSSACESAEPVVMFAMGDE